MYPYQLSLSPDTGNLPVSVYIIIAVIAAVVIIASIVAGVVSKNKKNK